MGVTFDIIGPEFQRKDTSAYQLSILVGMDSLVYSVLNSSSNQLLRLKTYQVPDTDNLRDYLEELLSVITNDDLLGLLYRRVKIAFQDTQTTLVPSRLYNAENKNLYLEELSSEKLNGLIHNDSLDTFKIQVIYNVASDLEKMLKEQFPTSQLYHVATPYLHGCREMLPEDHQQSVFIHFYKESFNLAVFEKKSLIFFNAFSYHSANDVLYYLLLTMEQYGLSPETTRVNLSGQIVEASEIYKMLYRYIADLQFIPEPPFVKFGKSAGKVQPHLFFDLYAMALHT